LGAWGGGYSGNSLSSKVRRQPLNGFAYHGQVMQDCRRQYIIAEECLL
jgi:hypothetical protein